MRDLALERIEAVGPEPRHLADVHGGEIADRTQRGVSSGGCVIGFWGLVVGGPFTHNGFGGHGEPHVFGSVDELQDGAGGLVVVSVEGLDAQHARVAARAIEVALAEGGEDFGEVREWGLFGRVSLDRGVFGWNDREWRAPCGCRLK